MHINLRRKDHKSSDNLLYFSNLFSVQHRKQILAKHSIKRGERLGGLFPLRYAPPSPGFLMEHRCSAMPARMASLWDQSPAELPGLLLPSFRSKHTAFSRWMSSAELESKPSKGTWSMEACLRWPITYFPPQCFQQHLVSYLRSLWAFAVPGFTHGPSIPSSWLVCSVLQRQSVLSLEEIIGCLGIAANNPYWSTPENAVFD